MNPLRKITSIAIAIIFSLPAQANPWKLAEELLIHRNDKLTFTPTKDKYFTGGFLRDITFTEVKSSPKSFIVEGHILGKNTQAPWERISIYIGQDKESIPTLAAMTNSDGNFKFRLWIIEDDRESVIQTAKDFSGYLYAGGSFKKPNGISLGSYTQRFSLKSLIELSKKQEKQNIEPEKDPFTEQ